MRYGIAAAVLVSVTGNAIAATVVYPVQTGQETARFRQGVPTLDLETPTGAIEITPLPLDHGHVSFGLGIYNKTVQPANFGIENVTATVGGQTVRILSVDELRRSAKNRAMWTQIGIAVLSGAAAAVVANAHTTNTSYGRMRTPHGSYSWSNSYRDNSLGVIGATAAVTGGAAGIVGVRNRLDYTLANLNDEIIQTTTVAMDASYGGKIVLDKLPAAKLPYDVHLSINWNGTLYPFVFRVTQPGVATPAPYGPAPVTTAAIAQPASPAPSGLAYAPSAAPAMAAIGGVPAPRQLTPYEQGRRQALAALAANGALPN
jgi:hypothetical protein